MRDDHCIPCRKTGDRLPGMVAGRSPSCAMGVVSPSSPSPSSPFLPACRPTLGCSRNRSGITNMTVANPTYAPIPHPPQGFKSFAAFYPFYLGEHSLPTTRRLHLVGTTIALLAQSRAAVSLIPRILLILGDSVKDPTLRRLVERAITRTQALQMVGSLKLVLAGIVSAYACAWVSHFFVEKNRPATFKYPIWSLRGDLRLWWEVVTLQRGI